MTRVRWNICLLLLLTVTLSFLDRLNLSVAAKPLQEEFHIPNTQLGWIFTAFGIGYALFQIPGGMLADKLGPRRVISAAILTWSGLTAVTAVADRLPFSAWLGLPLSLAVIRLLIGVAQAPALTNSNRVVACWLAPGERARGNGLFVMGVGVGGVLTPPFVVWLLGNWGWRVTFAVCGVVGLVLAAIWQWYSTELPEQHSGVNAAELSHIRSGRTSETQALVRSVPWRAFFRDGNVMLLILSYGMQGYTTYVFYTWFYLYVVNVRHLPPVEAGLWSSAPFLLFGLMSLGGGFASDFAVRRLGPRWGRRTCIFIGLFGACLVLLIGGRIANPYFAAGVLSLGAGFNAFATVSFWAATIDISREYAGSLSGFMNMAGNIGGAISPALTPYLAERYGWIMAIDVAALAIGSAGLFWFFVNAEKELRVEPSPVRQQAAC